MTAGRNQRLSPVLLQSSIGLLILAALILLAVSTLWLKNIRFGSRSYRATVLFSDAAGMLVGTRVDYRGVRVGQVVSVTPQPEGVAVEVEISPNDRLISSRSEIQARQSGLIGETSINIIPTVAVLPQEVDYKPLDKECNPEVIICNGSILEGQDALDVNALIRAMMRISDFFSEPEINNAIRSLATQTPEALKDISRFSNEAATLLREINQDGGVKNIRRTLNSVDQTAQDLSVLSREATGTIRSLNQGGTVPEINRSLRSVGSAAEQIQTFLEVNNQRLGATLTSLQGTSNQLQVSVKNLEPPLVQLLTQVNDQDTVGNLNQALADLKAVADNANQLTGNLNQFADRLNDPQTILLLQQLLESARAATQNLEKITSDVDQLTGNPALREQLIRLIQGLSNLVSTTEHLTKQVQYAQQLNQLSDDLALVARAQELQTPRAIPAEPQKAVTKP
jgi:phospholipid/cholesterol/gamma-HCH transport system substrate-binding protein